MRLIIIFDFPDGVFKMREEHIDELGRFYAAAYIRTYIITAFVFLGSELFFYYEDIAEQRFDNVLVRSYRIRISYCKRLPVPKSSYTVGNYSVGSEISSAYDVSGTRR